MCELNVPEGPEIRRAADELESVLVGKTLRAVWFKFPSLHRQQATFAKSQIRAIETHGKALLTHFDCGKSIYTHNQLYGVWQIHARGEPLHVSRDPRIKLETHQHCVVLYSASDIEVWKSSELAKHPFLAKLGPDLLDARLQVVDVSARLRSTRFARKQLAQVLLDQAFMAGIGNYLRTEMLFYAGIAPERCAESLSDVELNALAQSILDVAQRSYRSGGVTNEAAMRGLIPTKGVDFEGYRFAIFERDGLACYRCSSVITRTDKFGRRLYICPRCQPTRQSMR